MSTKTVSRTGIDHSHGRAALPLPSRVFTPDHTPADLDESPELRRLHDAHKARQERWGVAPRPAAPVRRSPPAASDHVPVLRIVPLIVTGYWGYHALRQGQWDWQPPSIKSIQDIICAAYQVSHADMVGARRYAPFVEARQVGMWLCRHLRPDLSLPFIGRMFGKDHTTVLHALRKIDRLYEAGELELPESLKQYAPPRGGKENGR